MSPVPPTRPTATRPQVVAIDGPAGSGKSTLARRLAAALGADWAYLDTGAMYRAVTVVALGEGIDLSRPDAAARLAQIAKESAIHLDAKSGAVSIGGRDVTEAIRSVPVNAAVSLVAATPAVREVMKAHQRRFAQENGQIVAEGRDMGTAVFPLAALKVFLKADVSERVRRRVEEMRRKDPHLDPEDVRKALVERDRIDEGRAVDPLVKAPDAVVVETTGVTPDKVLEAVLALVRSRIPHDVAG